MDVYQIIKQDHETASRLMERIAESSERAVKTREENFAKLRGELEAHTSAEQAIVYPALQEFDETRALALEAIEEHAIVEQLLADLSGMDVGSEEWTAKFTVLKENIEHHVEEEENDMFDKARKVLSDEQADELGQRFQKMKKQAH